MHVKKGMTVKVINGNHKDMEGKVLNVFPKKLAVLLEIGFGMSQALGDGGSPD